MIDEKLVRHIAQLCRIRIDGTEVAQFARELDTIVRYVEKLRDVEVGGVSPIFHITGRENAAREDSAVESGGVALPNIHRDLLEQQAPRYRDGEVRVPKIFDAYG